MKKQKVKSNTISLPLDGEVIELEKVNDPVFSEKTMGDGFAAIPTDGVIKAPFSGKVELVFSYKTCDWIKVNIWCRSIDSYWHQYR